MMGLGGYANQLIVVIAVIVVLEDAVQGPLGEWRKRETFGSGEKECLRSHWSWLIQADDL